MDNKYYIYHWTQIDRLLTILEDGIIYAGKYLSKEHPTFAWETPSPYVFTRIYVETSLEKKTHFGLSLILHPKILYEQSSIYNPGWYSKPYEESMYINIYDKNTLEETIKTVLENVIERDELLFQKSSGEIINDPPMMRHELLFIARIILSDFLIGLIIPEKETKNVKKILKKKKMEHIKIFTGDKFPTYEELGL